MVDSVIWSGKKGEPNDGQDSDGPVFASKSITFYFIFLISGERERISGVLSNIYMQ